MTIPPIHDYEWIVALLFFQLKLIYHFKDDLKSLYLFYNLN